MSHDGPDFEEGEEVLPVELLSEGASWNDFHGKPWWKGAQYFRLDERNRTVTGQCRHTFEVDEDDGSTRHIVCARCGYGKYTHAQLSPTGELVDSGE